MPGTEFECAIARSQITRFVAGENLNGAVMRQLEIHVNACQGCRQLLEDKKRVLSGGVAETMMVSGANALQPQVEVNLPVVEAESNVDEAREALRAQLRKSNLPSETISIPRVATAFAHASDSNGVEVVDLRGEAETAKPRTGLLSKLALVRRVDDAPKLTKENIQAAKEGYKANNPTFRKPLIFSTALAAVVCAMSFVANDPNAILGTKVGKSVASKTTKKSPAKPTVKRSKEAEAWRKVRMGAATNGTSVAAQPFAGTEPKPTPSRELKKVDVKTPVIKKPATKKTTSKPVVKTVSSRKSKSVKPEKAVSQSRKTVRKSATRRATTSKPTVKQPANAIRIYDTTGQPIH